MLTLRALGGAALARDDVPLDGASSQQRRTALLTVIACAGTQGVSRDTLLALLWPESSEDRARHALSQWLFLMRRDLGIDDLISGSHTLRLNAARITADVSEFDRAIAAKDWSTAAAFYRGQLLEGFVLSNASEFGHWLDRERDRRHRAALRAVEQLARDAEAHDPMQAIAWWQRLSVLDPHSGPIAAKVIRLLSAFGDTVAALAFARRHEDALRAALDLSPSPEVAELMHGLRRELQTRSAESASGQLCRSDDPWVRFVRDRLAPSYVIDRVSSRNSLMTSFAARATSDLKPVTLKVFAPELLARADSLRLLEMLQAAAGVQHENLETPAEIAIVDGIMFLAVEGEREETLRDRMIAASPLSVSDAVDIGIHMAAGLAHAHEHSVVHGNVNPRRISLRPTGARLTEVGVLPALAATMVRSPHDSGFPSGARAYMSPEQLMDDGAADAPSDVYSLGCVMYEMFAGRLPHADESTRVSIKARLREPAAAIGAQSYQRPAGLDALIAAMLSPIRAARPGALAVHQALEVLNDARISWSERRLRVV